MGAISNLYGFISGQWQKAPIPFGYSEQVVELLKNEDLLGGVNTLVGNTVPVGQIWVTTHVTFIYVGTITNVQLHLEIWTPDVIFIEALIPPVSGKRYNKQGFWLMKAGDYWKLLVLNATVGDALYLTYIGYAVDLNK